MTHVIKYLAHLVGRKPFDPTFGVETFSGGHHTVNDIRQPHNVRTRS